MSKGDTFENDLLKAIFNASAIANLLDNAAASPLTNLYLSLHTADPGEAGNQTTSECNYTGYARVAVARTTGGFTVTGSSVSPVADVVFPNPTNATNLPQTAPYWAVGTAASGAGKILYSGTITTNPVGGIVISNTGVSPTIGAGSTITED